MAKKNKRRAAREAAREKRFKFALEQLCKRARAEPVTTTGDWRADLANNPPMPCTRSLEGWNFVLSMEIRDGIAHWHLGAKMVPHGRPSCVQDWQRLERALVVLRAPVDDAWVQHVRGSFAPDQVQHFGWYIDAAGVAHAERYGAEALAEFEAEKAEVHAFGGALHASGQWPDIADGT